MKAYTVGDRVQFVSRGWGGGQRVGIIRLIENGLYTIDIGCHMLHSIKEEEIHHTLNIITEANHNEDN